MADPVDDSRPGGAYIGIWATARSLEEVEDLVESAVEGSGEWVLDRLYSIERVAYDERPDDLADLPPRRDRSEVHSINIDEWGEGQGPDGPDGDGGGGPERWGTPGGRIS